MAKKPKEKKPLASTEEKIKKEFEFKLTGKEIETRARAAGKLFREIQRLILELEEIKQERSAQIKAKASERDHHLAVIDDEKENRVVEVMMIRDYESKLVKYLFEGKTLEERAMTAQELQMEIPFHDVRAKKSKKEPTGAQKVYAAKGTTIANGKTNENDIDQTIREETHRRTKRSSVDGVYGNA